MVYLGIYFGILFMKHTSKPRSEVFIVRGLILKALCRSNRDSELLHREFGFL